MRELHSIELENSISFPVNVAYCTIQKIRNSINLEKKVKIHLAEYRKIKSINYLIGKINGEFNNQKI